MPLNALACKSSAVSSEIRPMRSAKGTTFPTIDLRTKVPNAPIGPDNAG